MRRSLPVAVLATVIVTTLAVPASAHVTVSPNTAPKGGYAKLAFRVPTEKDDASTTKVEVDFPVEHPIASVSVQPHPGWTYTVDKSTLSVPVKTDDGDSITQAVTRITWIGGQIKPGEFDEFDVTAGPLPSDVDALQLKAVQTYSNGDVVRWIDTQASGGAEPEHPAPMLTLASASATTVPAGSAATTSDRRARALGVIGIALGAVAIVLAARRRKGVGS